MTKNFIGEKEKCTNKGNDKHEDDDTKFQNPRWNLWNKLLNALHLSKRCKRGQNEGKINFRMVIFFYTSTYCMCIQTFEDFGWDLKGAEKSDEKFYWREIKNGQIKGMKSMRMTILAQFNKSYPMFVPNFKILVAAVPEKSLMKSKDYTHTDKHCYGNNKNYIPTIYFICRRHNIVYSKYRLITYR